MKLIANPLELIGEARCSGEEATGEIKFSKNSKGSAKLAQKEYNRGMGNGMEGTGIDPDLEIEMRWGPEVGATNRIS